MHFIINGKPRDFSQLASGAYLNDLIEALELKGDRIAVEYNGAIVPRAEWGGTALADGARLEIVHFVGGGSGETQQQKKCSNLGLLEIVESHPLLRVPQVPILGPGFVLLQTVTVLVS